ncbi:hypothetical protein [Cellulomonas sp. HZM]|uniref:hypothetical protein n=1 Tax=Cellulomonas sp. HZM TaxID=1454010 RepID=UPI0012DD84C0|nr:hypothetical protein [Cellulomonas sp. HZM]
MHHPRTTRPSARRARHVAVVAALAVIALLASFVGGTQVAGAASPGAKTYLRDVTVSPKKPRVVKLTSLPKNATAATFDVTGRFAWRSTAISLCPGKKVLAECVDEPAMKTPVQKKRTVRVTVPLVGSGRVVTVGTSRASVRVTLRLVSYSTDLKDGLPVTYLRSAVVKQGGTVTVDASRMLAAASSARFTVKAKFAWRPTKIVVCAGTRITEACAAHPVLVTPKQKGASASVTIPMAGKKGKVTIRSSSASVRVWLVLKKMTLVRTAPATSAPSPSASPTGTSTTTAKPSPSATSTTSSPAPTATATTDPPKPTSTPTATAAPTPTSTPTSTPTATQTPVATPTPTSSSAARPGPSNTGVPAGTKLTVREGDWTITTPNTVIDSMDVRGFVSIKTTGVVIKNSIIRGRDTAYDKAMIMVDQTVPSSVSVVDTTLAASTPSPHIRGVIGARFSLTRVDAYDVVDQVLIIGDDVTVQDSWLHDNAYFEQDPNYNNTPSHDDNVQISIGKNLRFVNNTMTGTHNSVMMVTQDRGKVSDLVFSGNHVDGGACSVNLAEKAYGPLSGLTFTDNVFGRNTTLNNCAIISPLSTTALLTLARNYYTDGAAVTVRRG